MSSALAPKRWPGDANVATSPLCRLRSVVSRSGVGGGEWGVVVGGGGGGSRYSLSGCCMSVVPIGGGTCAGRFYCSSRDRAITPMVTATTITANSTFARSLVGGPVSVTVRSLGGAVRAAWWRCPARTLSMWCLCCAVARCVGCVFGIMHAIRGTATWASGAICRRARCCDGAAAHRLWLSRSAHGRGGRCSDGGNILCGVVWCVAWCVGVIVAGWFAGRVCLCRAFDVAVRGAGVAVYMADTGGSCCVWSACRHGGCC